MLTAIDLQLKCGFMPHYVKCGIKYVNISPSLSNFTWFTGAGDAPVLQ